MPTTSATRRPAVALAASFGVRAASRFCAMARARATSVSSNLVSE
ncbi:hypothetical protein ABIA45_007004 [Bradyrhizobium sp. USDA 336]